MFSHASMFLARAIRAVNCEIGNSGFLVVKASSMESR